MTRSRPYGAVFLPGLDDETVYLRQVDLVGTVDKTGRTGLPAGSLIESLEPATGYDSS